MKLKLRPNSSPSGPAAVDITSAIRSRFQLLSSTNLVLVDEEGNEKAIDSSLKTGNYFVKFGQSKSSDNSPKPLKRSLPSGSLRVKASEGGRSIAVFVDGSRFGRAALHAATEFIRANDRLFIIHCLDHTNMEKSLDASLNAQVSLLRRTAARELLADALEEARSHHPDSKVSIESVVLESSSGGDDYRERAITFLKDHEFDAVFVGTRGISHGNHHVGSFSKYLARRATVPVFCYQKYLTRRSPSTSLR